jgi:hypothetical protein
MDQVTAHALDADKSNAVGDPCPAVDQAVAAEILKQAQALVQSQMTASTAIDGKLTSLLGQGVAISLALFGASALPLGRDAWLPGWAGLGFAVAGVLSASAALMAAWGLRCSKWAAPGLRPAKTCFPEILTAKPASAFYLMAWAYQDCAEENDRNLEATEKWHRRSLSILAAAPPTGAVAACIAWAHASGWWWPIPIAGVLLLGLVPASRRRMA